MIAISVTEELYFAAGLSYPAGSSLIGDDSKYLFLEMPFQYPFNALYKACFLYLYLSKESISVLEISLQLYFQTILN